PVVLLAVAATFSTAIDEKFVEYKDLIPVQAKEFISGLTTYDKHCLKEFGSNYWNYLSDEKALNFLKNKSPALFEKLEIFHNELKSAMDDLGKEAKTFVTEDVVGTARNLHNDIFTGVKPTIEEVKTKLHFVIMEYQALSAEAKAELGKQFSIPADVLKHEKLMEQLRKVFAKKN
ncbi:hypothetical protein PFISCL1PPCAC_8617, partial [Pristionchus fissidentatus]